MSMWPFQSLSECCELITDGTHYTPPPVTEGVPFLTVKDMADGGLNLAASSRMARAEYERAVAGNSAPKFGDVLFSKDGTVGKVHVVSDDREFAVLSSIAIIRPVRSIIDSAFLGYMLRYPGVLHEALNKKTGSAIRRLVLRDLKTLRIPLPPLPEQRRIFDLLSRAEGIVRLRREAEKKAAELISALFLDMFGDPATNPKGWPVTTLGNVLMNGPQNGLYKHSSHYGEGTPILRIDAFYDGQVRDMRALKRVRLTPEESTRYRLLPRDLVINRVNSPEYLGKSTIIPALSEQTVFESNMMRLTVDDARVMPEYMIALLQTTHTKTHFLAKAKHAINQSSINQQDVKSLAITAPPLTRQRDFVGRVELVRSIQSQLSAATSKAQATFDALLAQVFRG